MEIPEVSDKTITLYLHIYNHLIAFICDHFEDQSAVCHTILRNFHSQTANKHGDSEFPVRKLHRAVSSPLSQIFTFLLEIRW